MQLEKARRKEKAMQRTVEAIIKAKQGKKRQKGQAEAWEQETMKFFSSFGAYQDAGGYPVFYQAVRTLESEGVLSAIQNKKMNGRIPDLPLDWWIMPEIREASWKEVDRIRVSDLLSTRYYKQHLQLQTEEEWQRIIACHQFLSQADKREWASREERSYELFGDEKFLSSPEGRNFLFRTGLSLDKLLAKTYGEPFVFRVKPGVAFQNIKQVIIVENLSLFHVCNRILSERNSILSFDIDAVIYGEGKKIESSFRFFEDMFPASNPAIFYAGDIDPEGWAVYTRLKERYPAYQLSLFLPFYRFMLERGKEREFDEEQRKDEAVKKQIARELIASQYGQYVKKIEQLWEENKRIPQEVITYETIKM
jgi:hypothetical protein